MARVNVEDNTTAKTGAATQGEPGKGATTGPSEPTSRSLQREGRGGWRENWRGQSAPLAGPLSTLSPFDLWNAGPLAIMRRMNEDMDRMLGGFGFAPWSGGRGESWAFAPPIEVREDKGKLTVRAELPGLSKDDVKVEVTDEGLVISGERRNEDEQRGEGFYRSERSYGRFQRVIPLPDDVTDVQAAQAKFDNGVLEISLPLSENRRRHQIPVRTSDSGSEGARGTGQATTSTAGTTGSKT
ncbi:MAG TPA: Hsp20/alpha crystallin family protein [Vicinamibacteria bacterium]|jgi:HSP20 family protein